MFAIINVISLTKECFYEKKSRFYYDHFDIYGLCR
jgi:hypothetical protein